MSPVPMRVPVHSVSVTKEKSHILVGLEDGKLIVVGAGQPAEVSVDRQPRWWGAHASVSRWVPLGWGHLLVLTLQSRGGGMGQMGRGIWNGGGDGERDGRWMTMRKELGGGWGGAWEWGR